MVVSQSTEDNGEHGDPNLMSGRIRLEDHLLSQDSDPFLISVTEDQKDYQHLVSPKSSSRLESRNGGQGNVSFGARIM